MVKTPVIVAAISVATFVSAVVYLKRESADQPSATAQVRAASALEARDGAGPGGTQAAGAQADSAPPHSPASQPGSAAAPVPDDPRLAAFKVSPDNGSIEFVKGPDGSVIAEIDKDPSSPSFKKPLREYMYSQGKVIGLTAYRYVGDRVEVTRTAVSYKPDGSVDEFREATSYDFGEKNAKKPR